MIIQAMLALAVPLSGCLQKPAGSMWQSNFRLDSTFEQSRIFELKGSLLFVSQDFSRAALYTLPGGVLKWNVSARTKTSNKIPVSITTASACETGHYIAIFITATPTENNSTLLVLDRLTGAQMYSRVFPGRAQPAITAVGDKLILATLGVSKSVLYFVKVSTGELCLEGNSSTSPNTIAKTLGTKKLPTLALGGDLIYRGQIKDLSTLSRGFPIELKMVGPDVIAYYNNEDFMDEGKSRALRGDVLLKIPSAKAWSGDNLDDLWGLRYLTRFDPFYPTTWYGPVLAISKDSVLLPRHDHHIPPAVVWVNRSGKITSQKPLNCLQDYYSYHSKSWFVIVDQTNVFIWKNGNMIKNFPKISNCLVTVLKTGLLFSRAISGEGNNNQVLASFVHLG